MKEVIKKIDAAVRVLNNIEVKQKQNLLNMGGVIDLLESVIGDLQKIFGVIISSMMGYHAQSLA